MDLTPIIALALPFAALVAVGVILIYLIAKRIDDKRAENFEDRDN
jgi:hypothetical protein